MGLDRLRLSDGVDPRHAADVLAGQIAGGREVQGRPEFQASQQRYLVWVETCEAQLPYLTHDLEVIGMFDTPRSRMIRELTMGALRPMPLIDAEVKLQVGVLERMSADLQARLERVTRAPGKVVVVDTQVLLHYLPISELPWLDIVGGDRVRIVLPLRVIEELDRKKYAGRDDLAARARRILPRLRSLLGRGGAASEIADGVSLEVLVDPVHRFRPADADQEILDVCCELRQFGAATVTLVTGDTAMLIRAEALDIAAVEPDERYLRVRPGIAAGA